MNISSQNYAVPCHRSHILVLCHSFIHHPLAAGFFDTGYSIFFTRLCMPLPCMYVYSRGGPHTVLAPRPSLIYCAYVLTIGTCVHAVATESRVLFLSNHASFLHTTMQPIHPLFLHRFTLPRICGSSITLSHDHARPYQRLMHALTITSSISLPYDASPYQRIMFFSYHRIIHLFIT
jgi:hypothetical protein